MRVDALGFICCYACVARVGAVPFMEFPRELVMDVNKGPYPVVNVIVSSPNGQTEAEKGLRQARRAAMDRRAGAQERRRADARRASDTLNQEIDLGTRLRGLASVVRGLSSQRQNS